MKKSHYKFTAFIIFLLPAAALIISYLGLGERSEPALMNAAINSTISDVNNIVMNVYLNFRLFDTVFEAMLLIICVMGVLQFSSFNDAENTHIIPVKKQGHNFSNLMTDGVKLLYPFVLLVGVYIILSGLDSPGGGFQGGAIIAAIAMSYHFSTRKQMITVNKAATAEKAMFFLFLLLSTLFFILKDMGEMYRAYLIILNIIIGIKVFCGFVMIYMLFMQKSDGSEERQWK